MAVRFDPTQAGTVTPDVADGEGRTVTPQHPHDNAAPPVDEPHFTASFRAAPDLAPRVRPAFIGADPSGGIGLRAATFGAPPDPRLHELGHLLRDVPIPPDWESRIRAMVEYFRATPLAQRDHADVIRFLPALVLEETDLTMLAPACLREAPGFSQAMNDIIRAADPLARNQRIEAARSQPWFTPRAFELLRFMGDVFHLEAGGELRHEWSARDATGQYHDAGVSLGPSLRIRIDFNAARPYLPEIFPNTPHNALMLGGDLLLLNGLIFGLLSAGLAPDVLPSFREHVRQQGLFGFHGFNWKDGNFGDAWTNPLAHPLGFNLIATYLRQRGYSQWTALAGGMVMNFLWEFMWENYEGMSAHDFAFANLLGVITGSFNRLGIAFGADATRPLAANRRYTEFYYRTDGGRRYFLRTMPTAVTIDQPYAQRPLMAYDFAVGMSNERTGLTLWVSAEASPVPLSGGDVHGIRDLFSGVGFGVSLDLRAIGHSLLDR